MNALPQVHDPLRVASLLSDFENRAKHHPEAPAIHSGGKSLSYGQVEKLAAHLAARLQTSGIGAGDHVGIGIDRSPELIIALFAVVKSGAAYVPLDPSYPQARLSHMIASADLKLILSRSNLAGTFTAAGGPPVIHVEDTTDPQQEAPLPFSTPDHPLYAIFTSGSTGQPKAASVYRKGFSNLVDWYASELGLGPDDCTLVMSSPSFDLTQKNFFAPLKTGGQLVLDDGSIYDISRISGLIRDHSVTLLNCTPSAFYPLVDAAAAGNFEALSSLRFVVLGGEPISITRIRAWLEHSNCRAEIVNSYGPTECTDICAFHRLHRGNMDDFEFVPLGREIPNVTVTIRDEDLAEVPTGELGELCICGAGLGAGYLNDPERTAKSFALAGALYRTGDLARRLPCGTLEFRGRLDHQVKVKGFRIELGEIEIALEQHAGVREAVVIAKDNRLIAHVKGDANAAALKGHLADKLPAYMIPSEFHFAKDFPLTPNGKVDRIALAAGTTPAETATPAVSASEMEAKILTLWSEILERPLNDPAANFFDLGGTSIHLAVVHVRLREMTGKDFAITDLFARPSAKSLAELLSPQAVATAAPTNQDRARKQQAGFARFRRPTAR